MCIPVPQSRGPNAVVLGQRTRLEEENGGNERGKGGEKEGG